MARTSIPDGVASLLSRVESNATSRLAEVLRSGDRVVSISEWRVLDLLSDGLGHPMADVAHAVRLPAPTVTRLVDRVVSDNIAHRRADEWDRRRLLVFMTQRGQRLYRHLQPLVAKHEEELMTAMGAESDVAIVALHRLDDFLRRERA